MLELTVNRYKETGQNRTEYKWNTTNLPGAEEIRAMLNPKQLLVTVNDERGSLKLYPSLEPDPYNDEGQILYLKSVVTGQPVTRIGIAESATSPDVARLQKKDTFEPHGRRGLSQVTSSLAIALARDKGKTTGVQSARLNNQPSIISGLKTVDLTTPTTPFFMSEIPEYSRASLAQSARLGLLNREASVLVVTHFNQLVANVEAAIQNYQALLATYPQVSTPNK